MMSRTRSGGRVTDGAPGRKPNAAAPRTSAIGYGMSIASAKTSSTTTATRTPSSGSSTSGPSQHRDGHGRRPLPAPDEPHALAGGRLHVDVADRHVQRVRELLAHRVAVGSDLGRLQDERGVDVD